MEARAKAIELFNKIHFQICNDNGLAENDSTEICAKQCALITVNEILLSNPTWFIDQMKSTHNYWEDVRAALNAL